MVRPVLSDAGRTVDFVPEDCNHRAAELLSMTRAGLIGLTCTRLFAQPCRTQVISLFRDGAEGRALFGAFVFMASVLDMNVAAEGVETAEQLRILQELDCDEVQGVIVSRAMPAKEMQEMMRRNSLLSAERTAGFYA